MHLKRILAFFVLLNLGFSAQAETISTAGEFQLNQKENADQIVLSGAAADALYDSLLSRETIQELPCSDGMRIIAKPMLCVRSRSMQTRCYLEIGVDQNDFRLKDFCDGPNPSIIGVGNFPRHDPR